MWFGEQARHAREFGFLGGWCIHEQIALALRLLDAPTRDVEVWFAFPKQLSYDVGMRTKPVTIVCAGCGSTGQDAFLQTSQRHWEILQSAVLSGASMAGRSNLQVVWQGM